MGLTPTSRKNWKIKGTRWFIFKCEKINIYKKTGPSMDPVLFPGGKVEKSVSAHKTTWSHDPKDHNLHDDSENLNTNILSFPLFESVSWNSLPDTFRSLSTLALRKSLKGWPWIRHALSPNSFSVYTTMIFSETHTKVGFCSVAPS
jgi:hypothetical protein